MEKCRGSKGRARGLASRPLSRSFFSTSRRRRGLGQSRYTPRPRFPSFPRRASLPPFLCLTRPLVHAFSSQLVSQGHAQIEKKRRGG